MGYYTASFNTAAYAIRGSHGYHLVHPAHTVSNLSKDSGQEEAKSVGAGKSDQQVFIAHRRESDGMVQSLSEHLTGVGRLSARNAAKLQVAPFSGAAASLEQVGEILGLLHDLGKYSKDFQGYLGSAVGLIDQDADEYVDAGRLRGKIDHSTAGAQFIWRELAKLGPKGNLCGQLLALCIASHHSGLIDCLRPDGSDNFSRRMAKPEVDVHLEEALEKIDAPVRERLANLLGQGQILDALFGFAQGIAELENHAERSQTVLQFKLGLFVRFLFSCLIDADRLDTADFERPHGKAMRHNGSYPNWEVLSRRLDEHIAAMPDRNPVDAIRRDVSSHCFAAAARKQGIFTLTVPTGGGKTLASLRFALHHARRNRLDRVIYVIPFTSIIDQNADTVRKILEPASEQVVPGSVVLEHHSNLTLEKQTWRSKILSENWDAPVVFTTTVQLFETLFGAGTRGARRMHQLARSVVIFDEAQALPLRCIHLFNNAINFLVESCSSTVVLCTATQPLLAGVDPGKGAARCRPEDEIIPDVNRFFLALKRTELIPQHKPRGWTDQEVVRLACTEIRESGSCLAIVNTRKTARTLFEAAVTEVPQGVFHLSTSMCPAHRRAVLEEVRSRLAAGEPVFCVSTQLIEAGVDIDFGSVIRHIAGLDSIAQASGRCNRNGRRPVGHVHLINPAEEQIDRLIDIRVGRDVAMRVMSEFSENPRTFKNDLLGPEALRRYFDYYFFQRSAEMGYPVSGEMTGRDDTLLNLLGENSIATHDYSQRQHTVPPTHLHQSFMTAAQAFKAIDAPTQGVLVPYGEEGRYLIEQICGAYKPELHFDLLRRAQQYSVNVFSHIFERLLQSNAACEVGEGVGVYHLRSEYYSQQFGLSDSPVSLKETLYV